MYRFVKRRPEAEARLSRDLDYTLAKTEDIPVMDKWLSLIRDTLQRYGIQTAEMYNFDETGFMMGIIKGFYMIIRSDRRGNGRHVQPGNLDWVTVNACISGKEWVLPPLIIFKRAYVLST